MQLASAAFERAVALSVPDPEDRSRVHQAFPVAMAGLVASLVELGEVEKASAEGRRALEICTANGIGAQAHPLVRVLALAEAKLGAHDEACRRLDGLIAAQTELGVTGLHLGATYEARTRVAIWAGDEAAVERYGRLTAQEYRHGLGSPLGARYERLMDEARRTVALTLPKLLDFGSTRAAVGREAATMVVTQLFEGAETTRDRSGRILEVLCSGSASTTGYLYLCTDAGPVLVASRGAQEPVGLLDYVRECLKRDLDASDGETAIVSIEETRLSPGASVFTDDTGRTYRPTLLTALVKDVPRHAAVVVMVITAGEHRAADFALTSALANYMIDAGDTPGIAARG
jgi:hypothetical protein